MTALRLCERLNCSPEELENYPFHRVHNWTVILSYEAEIAKQNRG